MGRKGCGIWLQAPVLLLVFGVSSVWASASAELKAFQREVGSLAGEFSQRVTDKYGAVIQRSSGRVLLARPFKFRWDYQEPYEQVIVSNGAQIWFYDADLEQVTIRSVDGSLGGGIALFLSGDRPIESEFSLAPLPDSGGMEWVLARPLTGSGDFQSIKVGFRDGKLAVIEVVDHFGQVTRLVFSVLVRNPEVSESRFVFVPPDGVDVLRSGGH